MYNIYNLKKNEKWFASSAETVVGDDDTYKWAY